MRLFGLPGGFCGSWSGCSHPLLLRSIGPALLCAVAGSVWGQATPPDTVRRTVRLPEARVEAQGIDEPAVPSPLPGPPGAYVTRLNLKQLQLRPASLATVLSQRSPLVLRQYGPGQLASLSLRGGTAQHVAVVWHGFNINYPTVGQADLNLLPLTAFWGSGELRHGPDAGIGSGAISGALVLEGSELEMRNVADSVEPRTYHRTERADLGLSVGAFGTRALTAGVAGLYYRHSFNTRVQWSAAANDFPYRYATFRGAETARQINATTRIYQVTHDQAFELPGRWTLQANAWLSGADRQIPPPLNTPNTHAHQRDASRRVVLWAMHGPTKVRLASFTDEIDYTDSVSGPSDSHSQSWQAQAEHRVSLPWHLVLHGAVEAQHFRAQADGYGPRLRTENRAAAVVTLQYQTKPYDGLVSSDALKAYLTLRQAVLPGRWVPLMPMLGVDVPLPVGGRHRLVLRASASRSYRAPTLNERYWQRSGNPKLLPELSRNYQAGLHYEHALGIGPPYFLETALVAFDQRVTDWVQWVPVDATGLWRPRNLRRVHSRGLEGQLELRHESWHVTQLNLSGQWLQTRKIAGDVLDPDPVGVQLPYVAPLSAAIVLTHEHRLRGQPRSYPSKGLILLTQCGATATSWRNTNASGTESLPPYGLLNAGVGLKWTWSHLKQALTAQLDGFNLLDARYQSQTNRPMPGRSWQVSVSLELSRERAASQRNP